MMPEIICTELANGDLRLLMDADSRHELAMALEGDRGFWSILHDLFEPYFTNGSYEPFDAGEANPFVGLTSAPCIAEAITVLDNGDKVIDGKFWYFDRYMICDPLEELVETGETVFTLASE